MTEDDKKALNEILRTVTYIAEKVERIEQILEPQEEIKSEIAKALSLGKGISDYGIGSAKGAVGQRALTDDERLALGLPVRDTVAYERGVH